MSTARIYTLHKIISLDMSRARIAKALNDILSQHERILNSIEPTVVKLKRTEKMHA